MMEPQELLSVKQRFGIIGNSPRLNHAIQVAVQVAATDMTVLITGESGVGKESFSKIIHHLSARKHGSFIAINCGAIPEGTIDSELFGHEKGSFTGAVDARKGYFEVTDGGTIFLDEIGEMPLSTQARLLRVLENGEFIRVGSSKVQKTNVRVVAATNVNLLNAVEKGSFREDLYYRLNTVPIFVPPLRERGDDILLLFRKFAADFSEKYRVKPISPNEEAKEQLLKYRFPGNIRQLKNLVEQMSVLETDRGIDSETLAKYLPDYRTDYLPALFRDSRETQGMNERDLLYKVLFDMKKDMAELKKVVFGMMNGNVTTMESEPALHTLLADMTLAEPLSPNNAIVMPKAQPQSVVADDNQEEEVFHHIEDLSRHDSESLSIEEKERELIIKALKKNKNKRKYAAQDLGISERTLYRKIKQLNIDEEA